MKATMDANGVITIEPETGAEAFALKQWSETNGILVNDLMRAENFWWRGSGMLVKATLPEVP